MFDIQKCHRIYRGYYNIFWRNVMKKQTGILFLSALIILNAAIVCGGEGQIDIAKLPYSISSPGSYIVVGELELAATGNHGINITSDNVTLDLNGHTIKGPGKAAGTTDSGIYIGASTRKGITIKNGTVRDWPDTGVNGDYARSCTFTNLKCFNNGKHGLYASINCIITGNICSDNTQHGIYVSESCTVSNNICEDNTKDGIYASQGNTITDNNIYSNEEIGINVSSRNFVKSNTVSFNKGNGIECYIYNRIVGNVCSSNGFMGDGAGILITTTGNAVERNLVSSNDRGIESKPSTGKNFIASNRASGNGTNYDILISKNVVGKIVDMSSGGEITTTDPFTNFAY
jgi:parallel beta-helix repeat protein